MGMQRTHPVVEQLACHDALHLDSALDEFDGALLPRLKVVRQLHEAAGAAAADLARAFSVSS